MQNSFYIKQSTPEAVKTIVPQWIEPLNWEIGFRDAQFYYQIDPHGFFTAFLQTGKQEGQEAEPIGNIHGVKIDVQRKEAFIGYFFIKPEYRGRKYGLRLFDQALRYLQGYNVGLTAVLDKVGLYEKKGFKTYGTVNYYYLGGKGKTYFEEQDARIVKLDKIPIQEVKKYEQECGFNMPINFTKKWIQQEGFNIGYWQDEKLKGLAVLRPTTNMYKVGPLFANTPQIGRKIIKSMLSYAESQGKKICFPAIGNNKDACALISQFDGSLLLELKLMYTKCPPSHMKDERIYSRYDPAV